MSASAAPTDAASAAATDADPIPPGELDELEPAHPPLIDEDGRVRLSFSRIDTFQRCPAQFHFSYIDRLPGVPGPHLSFGTSIHAALEAFYDRKLPECPSEDELLQFLFENWETEGFEQLPREDQISFYRHAQDVLRRFHRREHEHYRLPAAVEAWFELPVGDHAIVVGSIDRVDIDEDGNLYVIDYKTNRKVKNRARVAGSLQLAIYALACEHLYGRLPVAVSLDFVVAGLEVRVPIEDIDLDAARTAVIDTAAAIRADAFPATPNRLCDWCDFRAVCPAWEGEGPDVLGPAVTELERLRRQVRRDVASMRALEVAVDRLATNPTVTTE